MKRIFYLFSLLALLVVGGSNAVAQNKWVRTALTDLKPTDQVVIVDVQNKYAMANDNGTSKDPAAISVTLSPDGSELTSDVADNMKWNVISDNGKYQFHPNGDAKNYLYCTNTNKGVRVGSGDNKDFVPYSKDNYVGLYNDVSSKGSTTRRYIGVYNGSDWRCYSTVHDNIKTTSIAYYKLTSSSEPTKTSTSLSFGDNADKTFWKGDKEGTTFTQTATLTPAVEGAKITYSSSDENLALVDENTGEVTVSTDKEGTATITAKYEGDDTHASASASYTITVDPLYSNISELKAAKSGTKAVLRLTDAKFTYVDGANHYLQDATGAIDVYNKNLEYKAGDVLNGIVSVTYSPYNDLPEVKDFSAIGELKVTSGNAPAPDTITIADAKKAENICKYVVIKNVTVTPGTESGYASAASGNESIDIYKRNQKYDKGQYDLTGIASIHNGTHQIAFISYAPDFTIDESANSNAITAGKNGTVTIIRTFNANAWNTLVLPFDLTAEQISAAFGASAKVAAYTGATANADNTYTLNFNSATAITANVPVFIYGAENKADGYTFTGVEVKAAEPTQKAENFNFVGTYAKTTVPAGNYFINMENKLFKAGDDKTNISATRATFQPTSTAATAKGLGFRIAGDGETTAINAVTIQKDAGKAAYNLSGKRVNGAYKGIVIQNGKKFMQK